MHWRRVIQGLIGSLLLWGGMAAANPLEQLQRALDYAREGEHSLARTLLEPVLISPWISHDLRARAYYQRGLLHYQDEHWVSARQDYQRSLQFDPQQPAANNALGWLHLHGLGASSDPVMALHHYRQAAIGGHTEAQYNLGLMLLRSSEPAQPLKALHWFQQAARAGHRQAQAQAGLLLARGHGLTLLPDPAGARTYLEPAATDGHVHAQLELALLALAHPEQNAETGSARYWLQQAALAGNIDAQAHLGYLLMDQDADRALMWFRQAAKMGHAGAQAHVGYFYQRGIGTAADAQLAFRWYRRAAQRDHANAQFNLARLYQHGDGAPQSDQRARYWLQRAATADHGRARAALRQLLGKRGLRCGDDSAEIDALTPICIED